MTAIASMVIVNLHMHVVQPLGDVEEGDPTDDVTPVGILTFELLPEVTVAPIIGERSLRICGSFTAIFTCEREQEKFNNGLGLGMEVRRQLWVRG